MKKETNEFVLVKRRFVDGSIRDVKKHITLVSGGEVIYCPECGEVVKNHQSSNPPHYEHHSRDGRPCSFKTKTHKEYT